METGDRDMKMGFAEAEKGALAPGVASMAGTPISDRGDAPGCIG